jgi:hypothetical protein
MQGGKVLLAGGGGKGGREGSGGGKHLNEEEGAEDGGTGARGVRAGAGEMKYSGGSPLLASQLVDMGVWERGLSPYTHRLIHIS